MKRILYVFAFVFMALLFSAVRVDAKISGSEVFEIEVGKEDTLNVYYTLEEDSEKNVNERINFSVVLKGLSETKNDYRWEHTFCYAINGGEEICEYDLTGSDQENAQYIYSNQTYNFTFYDGDMPYYSEELYFDYVLFKNKFVCLDCESDREIILSDIRFEKEDIDYKYDYRIDVSYVENESRKYVVNYFSNNKVFVKALFVNNSGSNLIKENAPVYKLVNEVCVGDNNCHEEVIEKVYSSSDAGNENPLSITPYLGNLNYYYYGDNLMYENNIIPYEFAKYKTTLVCLSNCESKRVVQNLVLNEDTYYFDYTKPDIDADNTIINSYVSGEIKYIKNSEVTITINDSQSGLNKDSLKYYIITPYPYYNSCSYGTSKTYSFENGESFFIGEGLSGAYCMYYQASDKLGNKYTSDYYVFYFDNAGPLISVDNSYDSSKYYNQVSLIPTFEDNYNGVKAIYYLWSKEVIIEDNYLLVKDNGKVFNEVISSSELSEDGSYYLYILSFDSIGNYSFNDLGVFNIDTVGLELNEVIVETSGLSSYSNTGTIKLTIDQIEEGEEFKCGFFNSDNVSISDLTVSCYNKQEFSVPSGYEGEYDLFVYVRDRANNYSLFKVMEGLKIDTKAPSVDFSILYDDDKYRIVNEVVINVSDLNGINENYLKYGWIEKNKSNVVNSDLSNSFNNGGTIGYPTEKYGEYRLYILTIDNIGNETLIALDKIFKIDTDIINISLVGEKVVSIIKGQKYEDLGAIAYKGEIINGGRVSEVVIEGNVDINKEGVYYITYTSGEGELRVSVTREVIVKSNSIYIICSVSFFIIGGFVICLRLFVRRKER